MTNRRLTFLMLWTSLVLGTRAAAQASDVTPPQLQDVAISPTTVDVSASSMVVQVDIGVTDDLSGVDSVFAAFIAPNGTILQSRAASIDGYTYRASITIPRYAANGTWLLTLTLVDAVSNRADIVPSVLQANGLPYSISVSSNPVDLTPPVPVSISFSPNVVDVSTQRQAVTVQIGVNDDLSGVVVDPKIFNKLTFILRSPVGQQILMVNADFSVTGTLTSVWQGTFVIPEHADAGLWSVSSLRVMDAAGNERYYSPSSLAALGLTSQLLVNASVSDRSPPTLAGFSFTPTVINTALGPQTVHVDLGLQDDLAGVSFENGTYYQRLYFTSPSGQLVPAFRTGFKRTTGTSLNGQWGANLVFPQFSEAGTWDATFLLIEDSTYNVHYLARNAIRGLGFSTSLTVIRPSLVVDGSIGPSGGVVQDQTFGARAEVIAPTGVLSSTISVAIDVLTSPLNIPMPSGFETTGSLYVNIELTPNPSPLPAPGLTLVLPLPSPQPPGLLLQLYKIDTSTGGLIAVTDANGSPISGIVGLDGLSATFSGVVNFSTFVGLLPNIVPIDISVKPGSDVSPINLGSNGVTPVAALSSASFDASRIDVSTVTFAGASAQRSTMEDVNGDGLPDQVFQFATPELKLSSTDTEATLTGRTFGGLRVRGTAPVRVRP